MKTAPTHRAKAGPGEQALGSVQLFASSPSDPRARRPVDALRVAMDVVLLVTTAVLSQIADDIDQAFSAFLHDLPGFLKIFWLTGFWGAVVWSLALLVITALRHRVKLTLEALGGVVLAVGIGVVAAAIVTGHVSEVLRALFDSNGPPVFPPLAPAITAAVITVMAPYLTVPARRVGRAFIVAQLVGALFLGVSQAFGAVAALAIGLLAGNLIHVLRGSPGGLPTVTRVNAALQISASLPEGVKPAADRSRGRCRVRRSRRTAVRSRSRSMAATRGRASSPRASGEHSGTAGSQRTARPSRSQYVEHEGFMTFLAGSAGVRVPEVVTAGLADNGDALIVVRPDGTPLAVTDAPTLSTDQVHDLWEQLLAPPRRGIAHAPDRPRPRRVASRRHGGVQRPLVGVGGVGRRPQARRPGPADRPHVAHFRPGHRLRRGAERRSATSS